MITIKIIIIGPDHIRTILTPLVIFRKYETIERIFLTEIIYFLNVLANIYLIDVFLGKLNGIKNRRLQSVSLQTESSGNTDYK